MAGATTTKMHDHHRAALHEKTEERSQVGRSHGSALPVRSQGNRGPERTVLS